MKIEERAVENLKSFEETIFGITAWPCSDYELSVMQLQTKCRDICMEFEIYMVLYPGSPLFREGISPHCGERDGASLAMYVSTQLSDALALIHPDNVSKGNKLTKGDAELNLPMTTT